MYVCNDTNKMSYCCDRTKTTCININDINALCLIKSITSDRVYNKERRWFERVLKVVGICNKFYYKRNEFLGL